MTKTILIIDDDDALRASIAAGLRRAGFAAVTADGAESANEILKLLKPDAIVLDRMMRGMDGVSALSKWRAANITTPVIMLTAMTGADNAIDGLTAGADDYLGKPFKLTELILRLNNLIKRAPAADAAELPDGLTLRGNDFYANGAAMQLSESERHFLLDLTNPVGNIVMTGAMTAKRLRLKLTAALPGLCLVTVRGKGYKLINNV